jgi:predicted Holliday junction resolvase-like endonuclease
MSAGALVICICVIIFMICQKRNIIKRVSALESVIDDLNHQSHKLNKTLKEINFEDDIKKIVNDKIEPLAKSLKEVKKITTEYRNQKSNSGIIDFEERVLNLYQDDKSESEIANILGVSVQQVELILSLNNPE